MRAALDPERQRSWVLAILKRAYQSKDVKTATRLLRHLARRLDQEHPCAAASVREGLEETVTVLTLGLSPRFQRSLATTNAAESLISRTRHVKRTGADLGRVAPRGGGQDEVVFTKRPFAVPLPEQVMVWCCWMCC